MPLAVGTFRAVGYRGLTDGGEHLALTYGDIGDGEDVLVGIHNECVAGDVFGSTQCRCQSHVDSSLEAVAREGRGVVLYLRTPAGTGAAELLGQVTESSDPDQDRDEPRYREEPDHTRTAEWAACDTGAQILTDLGVRSLRLLDPSSLSSVVLRGHGLRIAD